MMLNIKRTTCHEHNYKISTNLKSNYETKKKQRRKQNESNKKKGGKKYPITQIVSRLKQSTEQKALHAFSRATDITDITQVLHQTVFVLFFETFFSWSQICWSLRLYAYANVQGLTGSDF